jgi:hypothetical protein
MKNSLKMIKKEKREKQWKHHLENPETTFKMLVSV